VAWFKKSTPGNLDIDSLYPKRSVRQLVVFSDEGLSDLFVVHLESKDTNELWLYLRDEWTVFNTEGREFASTVMANLLGGAENLISSGMLTSESDVSTSYLSSSLGFGPEFYEDKVPDSLFLGLYLAEKLSTGWVPTDEEELDDFYDFFSEVPLFVGFFAPFKQILKRLTELFQENQHQMSVEFASRFAGALGRGYSVVEGRLADGKNPPSEKFRREILKISSLPALEGYRWPKLATIQYLSRKGLRLLKDLESNSEPIVATRFRANFLVGPQLNASFDTRSINGNLDLEDKSLKYQQILTYILFGHLNLVNKDREARKVILGPRSKRHGLEIGESLLEGLDDDSKEVYANWINDGDYTTNAPIARHALALSKVIPSAEFVWTRETAVLIANSGSEELQREALVASFRDGQWASIFNLDGIRRVLEWLDEEYLEFFFEKELDQSYYGAQKVIALADWASNRANQPLSRRDVLIALQILKMQNYQLQAARTSLFFQLAEQGKLPAPALAKQWPSFFGVWDTKQLLHFFGVEASDDYPIGVFDVIKLEDKDSFEIFAGILAKHLAYSQSYNIEALLETLEKFAKCRKPGALELLKGLLHDPQFKESRFDILDLLQSSDPTGHTVLDFVGRELSESTTETLLDALLLIGRDSFATFWRRNSKEVEQILAKNQSFPSFFWTNLDEIPLLVRENILSFTGFGLKVLESVTASSIGKMNSAQEELFVKFINKHIEVLSQDGILRAMLVASSLPLNKLATDHVKKSDLFAAYWLIMLESNLPYPQTAAFTYLESQVGDSNFADTLLMALDSNNSEARTLAIRVLRSVKAPDKLQQILRSLVENRNSDTWSIVSSNLEQLDDPSKLQEFTRQVFLSRRKSRNVKEKIKSSVDALIEDVESAVEQDVLLRMAFSSVAKDREWALKRIAQHQSEIVGVSVEKSWKSGLNV
jgi:hypothetical protein